MHVIQAQESFTKIAEIDNRPHRTLPQGGGRKGMSTPEKLGTLILHPTAEIFRRVNVVKCPICAREIVPLEPVEQLDIGDQWFWVHAECANDDTPKQAI